MWQCANVTNVMYMRRSVNVNNVNNAGKWEILNPKSQILNPKSPIPNLK
jgi:hypothetical protein